MTEIYLMSERGNGTTEEPVQPQVIKWKEVNKKKNGSCKAVLSTNTIDLFTVSSTFDMDKLGKICRHHWKEGLNTIKITKF